MEHEGHWKCPVSGAGLGLGLKGQGPWGGGEGPEGVTLFSFQGG